MRDIEIFDDIADWPGYAVSTRGRVIHRSHVDGRGVTRAERALDPQFLHKDRRRLGLIKGKKPYVVMWKDKTRSLVSVAELVAATFIDGYDSKDPEFSALLYRDGDEGNVARQNLVFVPKFVAKLRKRLTEIAQRSLSVETAGSASHAG
jgi:hypothetical protein